MTKLFYRTLDKYRQQKRKWYIWNAFALNDAEFWNIVSVTGCLPINKTSGAVNYI